MIFYDFFLFHLARVLGHYTLFNVGTFRHLIGQ